MKKIFIIGLFILACNIAFTQTQVGISCSNAVNFGLTTNVTFIQNTENGWLYFIATENNFYLKFKKINNHNNNFSLSVVNIYGSDCNNLNLLLSDTIYQDSDSILIFLNNLTIGNIYFINTKITTNNCNSGNCNNYSLFSVSYVPIVCGFNFALTPTSLTFNPSSLDFSGFDFGCMVLTNGGGPTQNPILSVCNYTTCNSSITIGEAYYLSAGLGNNLIQNYTLYAFSSVYPAGVTSIAVTNYTTNFIFPAPGTYTFASVLNDPNYCNILPPPLSNTLSPQDLCSCTNPVIAYSPLNCDFTVTPNPMCINQPYCVLIPPNDPQQINVFSSPNLSINPSHYSPTLTNTICTPSAGVLFSNPGIITVSLIISSAVASGGDALCRTYCVKQVTVLPELQPPVITGNTVGCLGQTINLSAFSPGAISYTWLPINQAGNTLTYVISGTQVFTVIAFNGGCFSQKTVTVVGQNCCLNEKEGSITFNNVNIMPFNTSGAIPWSSLQPGQFYSGNIAAPSNGIISGNYSFYGNINLNTQLTFSNTNIYFSEAATINQYHPLTVTQSYWLSCQMWRGIRSHATLSITTSIIEDAQFLVFPWVTNHPGIFINNSVFNKNYSVVYVSGTGISGSLNTANFIFTGNITTCRKLPSSIYANYHLATNIYVNILAPLLSTLNPITMNGSTVLSIPNNMLSNVGIQLNSLTNTLTVKVGEAITGPISSNSLKTNYFDMLLCGVKNNNSRVFVFNGVFQFINDNKSTPAIFHNGGITRVGSANTPGISDQKYRVTFLSDFIGIYGTGNGSIYATSNSYSSVTNANFIENYGGGFVNIVTSTMSACGIDLFGYNNSPSLTCIFNQNQATSGFRPARYHVFINELNTLSSAVYSISNNNLNGKNIGVFMQNVSNSYIHNNYISNNFNQLQLNLIHSCIDLNNCVNVFVTDNSLNSQNSSAPTNTIINGIQSNNCTNNIYACNDIYHVGACMKFQGPNPVGIFKNKLNTGASNPPVLYGIWLNNLGITGNIGFPYISPGFPPTINWGRAENEFGNFNYINNGYDTYATNSSSGSVIYYSGANNPNNPLCPFINASFANSIPYSKTLTALPFPLPCAIIGQLLTSNQNIPPYFSSAINSGTFTPTTLLNARRNITQLFRRGILSYSLHSGSANFILQNQVQNSNLHKFYLMDSLASTQLSLNAQTALQINNSLNPSGVAEQNQVIYNNIYHQFLITLTLTPQQLNQLKGLAQLCPFTDGNAVYQSRALLSRFDTTEYANPCEFGNLSNGNRFMHDHSKSIGSNQDDFIQLIPNPSFGEIILTGYSESVTLEIFNLMGQKVYEENIRQGQKNDISRLSAGSYIYRILTADKKEIKKDKLIIVR